MAKNELQSILRRLEKLEKADFVSGRQPKPAKGNTNFAGPSGGVRLLISRGFFKTKRPVSQVKNALEKQSYHYGVSQIQMALNRLSNRTGPLNASRDSGKKTYVARR